jgi:hypothetical protein
VKMRRTFAAERAATSASAPRVLEVMKPAYQPRNVSARTDTAPSIADSGPINRRKPMKILLAATATAVAITFATPALAFTVWPDVDFQWYADVGRYDARPAIAPPAPPAPRDGYIWSPERWETRGARQTLIAAHWVVDDYRAQLAIYNHPPIVADAR